MNIDDLIIPPQGVRRFNAELSSQLHQRARNFAILPPRDWSYCVTDTKRGRASWDSRTITVPSWAFSGNATKIHTRNRSTAPCFDFALYYFAHECAHAWAGPEAHHGPEFMRQFRLICPRHLQHYELSYKPANAAGAGITVDLSDLL